MAKSLIFVLLVVKNVLKADPYLAKTSDVDTSGRFPTKNWALKNLCACASVSVCLYWYILLWQELQMGNTQHFSKVLEVKDLQYNHSL